MSYTRDVLVMVPFLGRRGLVAVFGWGGGQINKGQLIHTKSVSKA